MMSSSMVAFLLGAVLVLLGSAEAGVAAVIPSPSIPGCLPPYLPGKVYAIGDWVSALTTTTTTPVSYIPCSPPGQGNCHPSGWTKEGGVTTTDTYNYRCHADIVCSNSAYSPDSVYFYLAWTKEETACMVSEENVG